jgi:CRISPR/Cas system-associated exonuclease Cas4 (RecB family)
MAIVALALAGASACLLLAAWLLARSTRVRIGAALISSDLGLDPIPPAPLSDRVLRLSGRPDLLLRERGRRRVYPVEVKPTRDSPTLYASDALQLAAYMVLTESTYGSEFAGYGIVRYRSGEFRVELTPELRRRCLAAVDAVRAARQATSVHRSHRVAAKCRACAVRTPCGEALP